jgi:hypothetical protein
MGLSLGGAPMSVESQPSSGLRVLSVLGSSLVAAPAASAPYVQAITGNAVQ